MKITVAGAVLVIAVVVAIVLLVQALNQAAPDSENQPDHLG